ncbi:lipid-A-disaccharide synthase [Halothermothrix orenii]|uniref:Lipid-A-disaccharide synthase n=1 Tax=Halothermothrix orenii (strain H 168 / OCM 544 / DSM 9562) TaxID=373903 RepID=B8CYY3_HALOH|nr:lipid-A-disaccharide synthase [Halothermothrix orenii]ACL70502.1 lipid-A-disaccharide synthase [Halothermothrix orenii H 168]
MGKIMVVAGEVSGDMHAARVVREIKKLAPETRFFGMGSKCLREAGVEVLVDPTDISTIGFSEALKNYRQHRDHLKMMKKALEREKPDVALLVDYSGFNIKMARITKRKKIPTVSYFSPSAWVWGKRRARKMARARAVIASVFPMEEKVYREAGAEVHFVGHPLLDMVNVEESKDEICRKLELDGEKPIIGLMPGSRKQEVEYLLPEMLKAAERLKKEKGDFQFVIPVAPGIDRDKIVEMASRYKLVLKVVEGANYEVMKASDFLVVASGTATLEATIIGTPMVIVYRTSWSTYHLGKLLVNLDYIGLPNIIADREIVPELLQQDVTADNIYREITNFMSKPYLIKSIKRDLEYVKNKLGRPGAVRRTAELVLKKGKLYI